MRVFSARSADDIRRIGPVDTAQISFHLHFGVVVISPPLDSPADRSRPAQIEPSSSSPLPASPRYQPSKKGRRVEKVQGAVVLGRETHLKVDKPCQPNNRRTAQRCLCPAVLAFRSRWVDVGRASSTDRGRCERHQEGTGRSGRADQIARCGGVAYLAGVGAGAIQLLKQFRPSGPWAKVEPT